MKTRIPKLFCPNDPQCEEQFDAGGKPVIISRFTCPEKAVVLFTGSFREVHFFLLTYTEIKAFDWLKALFSPSVSKKKKSYSKRTAFSGLVNRLNNFCSTIAMKHLNTV